MSRATERGRVADQEGPARRERRETILRAAVACFDERGYRGTSVGELARRAGTSPANLYEYFRDKQAILDAVIEGATNEFLHRSREIAERIADPRERLSVLVAALAEASVDDPRTGVARHDRSFAGAHARSVVDRAERLVAAECVHALRQIRPECSEQEAVVMVRAAFGYVLSVTHTEAPLRGRHLVEELVGGALAALTGDEGSPPDRSAQERP